MPADDFLDKLLSDARGNCFACNLIDSVEAGLFPRDRLKELMGDVLIEYRVDKANVTTSAAAIGLLNKIASGFLKKGAQKHVMAGVAGTKPTGKLSHALRSNTLCRWLDRMSDPHLIPEPKPQRSPAGIAAYGQLVDAINQEIVKNPNAVFGADKTLGYEVPAESYIGLAWLSRKMELPTAFPAGDDLRDVLGLDTPIGDFLVLLTCDAQTLDHHETARPTFADGGNSRFRVVADNISDNSWGTTVHLGKLLGGELLIDGVPERVAEKIPLRTLKPEFMPIGWVDEKRGNAANDSDEAFKDRLLKTRTEAEMRKFIREYLT